MTAAKSRDKEAIEATLNANVKNPYLEHKEAEESHGVSMSEIILETSHSVGIQNPYFGSNLGTSPSPMK